MPDTIWLASYPKSGNTWTRALLTALTRGEEPGGDPDLDLDALGHGPIASARGLLEHHLGFSTADLLPAETELLRPLADARLDASLEQLRFRKIHDGLRPAPGRPPIVPVEATRAAIYIVRDPREVAVSYAHHAGRDLEWGVRRLGESHAKEGDRRFHHTQFPQKLGTWSDHVEGWLDHDLFPVLTVRYEDLHAETERQLRRIAAFAGIDADDAAVTRAVAATRFERLQAREVERGFVERPRADGAFFRRGRSGAWADELPPALAEQIVADHHAVMARLGYDCAP